MQEKVLRNYNYKKYKKLFSTMTVNSDNLSGPKHKIAQISAEVILLFDFL